MEKKVTQKKTATKNTISKPKKTTKKKSDFDVHSLRDIDHYINNGIPWTLLSARERYLMGIYDPTTKKSLDDNDKP